MTIPPSHYEEVLADCSDHGGAIALLKQHRPYLEMIPSMRRPSESVITIPLPLIRVRHSSGSVGATGEMVRLPCDVAILMCDPEWKIKTGAEILVFIHRADEDFSDLLGRWRQTQMYLNKGYEWIMPDRHRHILSEGSEEVHPLFVLFDETPDRIQRGLRGADLPFVIQSGLETDAEENPFGLNDALSSEIFGLDES
ncbi:MAG: hypothetical protein HY785_27560 [Oscillatoriophycideae cyanobacterium NC_groundwater_1537_Pr4_S-0.65um_50_18]|nr:hypothetical protein [Oscillatoriophycideae cyanobacterium NC_groundwater_1537_Pr4_S-0.65um_50_18]